MAAFIIADTPKGSFRAVEVKEGGWAVNARDIDTAKAELLQRIESLEERLKSLENAIPKERVVILREVSMEEAEKEILELFSKGQTLYYSDIAEQLGLDLRLVVEICNKLQTEGEIEVVDDTLQRR
jgi:DNA-binding CsgD family transcriptional regulator